MDMGAAGKVALCHFVGQLEEDSALLHEMDGHGGRHWSSRMKTNGLLADLFDAIRQFNYSFAKEGTAQPKPYPRPWAEDKTERFGKDPIPIEDFDDWWNGKKEE